MKKVDKIGETPLSVSGCERSLASTRPLHQGRENVLITETAVEE